MNPFIIQNKKLDSVLAKYSKLSISISENRLRLLVYDENEKKIHFFFDYHLEYADLSSFYEKINSILNSTHFLKFFLDKKVSLTLEIENFSIIPSIFFEKNKSEVYLDFLYKKNDLVFSNVIDNLNIAIPFLASRDLFSKINFLESFKLDVKSTIYSVISNFRFFLNENLQEFDYQNFLFFTKNYLYLLIFYKNQLFFYKTYSIKSISLNFLIHKILQDITEINLDRFYHNFFIFGSINEDSVFYKKIKNYIKNINIFKKNKFIFDFSLFIKSYSDFFYKNLDLF